jgi:hypothetical protein
MVLFVENDAITVIDVKTGSIINQQEQRLILG